MKLIKFKRKNKLSYSGLSGLICADHVTTARFFFLPKKPKDQMIPIDEFMHTIITVANEAVIPNNFYAARSGKIIFN